MKLPGTATSAAWVPLTEIRRVFSTGDMTRNRIRRWRPWTSRGRRRAASGCVTQFHVTPSSPSFALKPFAWYSASDSPPKSTPSTSRSSDRASLSMPTRRFRPGSADSSRTSCVDPSRQADSGTGTAASCHMKPPKSASSPTSTPFASTFTWTSSTAIRRNRSSRPLEASSGNSRPADRPSTHVQTARPSVAFSPKPSAWYRARLPRPKSRLPIAETGEIVSRSRAKKRPSMPSAASKRMCCAGSARQTRSGT